MRSASIAGATGLPLSSHLYPEVSAHLLRANESADWLESRDWGLPLIAEPFEIKDDNIMVPDRPGNGIDRDEATVTRNAPHQRRGRRPRPTACDCYVAHP